MYHMHRPSIRWQRQSRPGNTTGCSLLIALMRGLAALQVAAAHLRAEMFPGLRDVGHPAIHYQVLAFATGFAHHAVVVFFLISGWLVGGSLLNKLAATGSAATTTAVGGDSPWRVYAIDRLTRLWTVLVPALGLMLLVGILTGAVDPTRTDVSTANDYSATAFFGNLLGLQTMAVDNYGGNYALWSLANETWYYIEFPLLVIALTSPSWTRRLGVAALLLLLGTTLRLPITVYFVLWLLGAAFSRIRIDCGRGTRTVLLALVAVCSIYFRLRGSNDDLSLESFPQDLVVSLPLLVFLSTMQAPLAVRSSSMRLIARVSRFLSELSFTLYVTHIPVIKLLQYIGRHMIGRDRLAPNAPLDCVIYGGMLLALLVAAWLCYLLFESRTARVRRAVKNALQPRLRSTSMASSIK
ncbi:acyltransferase [Massilia pinisoli]|uniref:Acyltransferase n=1 Tax=Massilia pinisoli TaxID=1772194 RepID=A0ABT1ZS18_9BURK|nr:acyltransferase [Massilia pinisoli]MCS0582728.1 acyltransferase [Massilia pinisoli]